MTPQEATPETTPETIEPAYVDAAFSTCDAHRIFCERTGSHADQTQYTRAIDATIKEEIDAGSSHARYRTKLCKAAALIEYWYRNAPETQLYRNRDAATLLMSVESSRPGALWARIRYMADEDEKKGR